MKAIVTAIFDDIRAGRNIENYLVIVIAVFISILGFTEKAEAGWVTAGILAVLSLLAYGRIGDVQRLEGLSEKIDRIGQAQLLVDHPETLMADMQTASELWIVGITLGRTIATHYSLFRQKLEHGNVIKVLLVEPESSASELAAYRDRRSRSQDSYNNTIRNTLKDFCTLRENTGGLLEIRVINSALSFGYFAIEPNSKNGKIYVEHYAFKSDAGDVPKLFLTPIDGFIYESFRNQLNALWNHATEWHCAE